jgi:hypothetical protein
MTESNPELSEVPNEEDIDTADANERVDVDPREEPNAPNREPSVERVGPAPDPAEQPGPPDPGTVEPDLPRGVESFERPGEQGNWDDGRED